MEDAYDLPSGADLTIAAGGQTDHFIDPATGQRTLNAPRVLGNPDGDFRLSARVDVAFAATFDAGVLLLWANDEVWAKLCFECSPDGQPMVATVENARSAPSLTTSQLAAGNARAQPPPWGPPPIYCACKHCISASTDTSTNPPTTSQDLQTPWRTTRRGCGTYLTPLS